MNLGIRPKLFLVSLALVAIAIGVADIVITRDLRPLLTDRIRDDLRLRTEILARDVSEAPFSTDDIADWDALADALGARARVRVTIVRRDGAVIGDTDIDPREIRSIENHAGRPEIAQALRSGAGTATRWSATLRERMLYVALPFRNVSGVSGVVRSAVPLTEVRQTIGRFRSMIGVASIVGILVAGLMTVLTSHWISRSLRSLTAVARRMASGDLWVRTRAAGRDEIGELGRAMDRLGESLSRTLDDLRSERDLHERILLDMREGVLLVDGAGRIAMVNPAGREMLLFGSDAVGRPLLEAVRNAELHDLLEHARAGSAAGSAEIEIRGNRPRRLLARAAPLSSGEGGTLCVLIDITEIRRLEAIRKDFVANVSHELRTPVAAIRSSSETLRESAAHDPAAIGTFLGIIERNALRMGRLVDDLLDLSRIEAGELRLATAPVDPAGVADQVVASFRARAEEKRIRLESRIRPSEFAVAADRRALEQVLTNLVDNAIKYSAEGASVTIEADLPGGIPRPERVAISVRDTGPGIEPRHLPRLFERFYRVDTGRSRDLGGTGLGLAIVKHLVEAMHGTVSVESTPGEGSVFRFVLPRA